MVFLTLYFSHVAWLIHGILFAEIIAYKNAFKTELIFYLIKEGLGCIKMFQNITPLIWNDKFFIQQPSKRRPRING